MKSLLLLVGIVSASHLSLMAQTSEARRQKIEERERKEPSKEAQARKQKSVEKVKKEGVPVLDTLPVIADSEEAKARRTEEVAQRAIALCITAVKGEGLDQETVDSLVKRYKADAFFSPKEAAFIKNPKPTEMERIQFSWRYECYWVLLWALGYVDSLERPEGVCDVPKAIAFLRDGGAEAFIKKAKLRPIGDILDQADLIYRYHWAVTSARLKGQEAPAKLDAGVVMERHYVLNWLIGYMDQPWDEISTDT